MAEGAVQVVGARAKMIASWPPLIYFVLGAILGIFWLGGTSIQVLTSEAWMKNQAVGHFSLSPFYEIYLFVTGMLPDSELVPFCFAWGVQLALIVASIGIELPKHPTWRYYGAWGLTILLIGVNSCGDWQYSTAYGQWGQLGFTVVILFLTFFCGLLAILAVMHGVKVWRAGQN